MERVLRRRMNILTHLTILVAMVGVLYLASYAPFLWAVCTLGKPAHRGPHYRSPVVYHFADWCIVHTPAQSLLLSWAGCFGMRYRMEMQAFYFAQGVSDPTERFHFNMRE